MKLKLVKKLGLLLAFIMSCQVLLSGCAEKLTPANEVAIAFADMLIVGDYTGAKEVLGYTDEDIKEFIDTYVEADIASIKSNLTVPGMYQAADEDARTMHTAQAEAFKRLTYTAEITESDKEKATVVLKTTYFDITALNEQSLNAAVEEFGLENVVDEAAAEAMIKLYIVKFGETMAAAVPQTEQKEITIEFEKSKVAVGGKTKTMWVPKDPGKFGEDLISAVSGV